jgi:hypothetical protein
MITQKIVVAGGISGVLVLSALTTGPAVASSVPAVAVPVMSNSSADLAKTVARRRDLRGFWKSVRAIQDPTAGVGDRRIRSQWICSWRDPGTGNVVDHSVKLGKRQAWSDYRLDKAQTRGVISIITEYGSQAKAKKRFKEINTFLRGCKGSYVNDQGTTVTTKRKRLPKKYGTAVGVFTTQANVNDADWLSYVAIAQKGKSLSFNRYSEQTSFPPIPPMWIAKKPRKAMNREVMIVVRRYLALGN